MTNGVLSITKGNGNRVAFKVVAGCDGYNIGKLVDAIVREGFETAEDLAELAISVDFGSRECLVVQHEEGAFTYMDIDDLPESYHDKRLFQMPDWNPRWRHGIASHTVTMHEWQTSKHKAGQ